MKPSRFVVIGFLLATEEAHIDRRIGQSANTVTEQAIRDNNGGDDYLFVCTVDNKGRLVLRSDRSRPGEERPPVELVRKLTIVAFSLMSEDAVIFQVTESEAAMAGVDPLRLTRDFVEKNRNTDLQFVCTMNQKGQVLFTYENLEAEAAA